jgi:hypothetical protein
MDYLFRELSQNKYIVLMRDFFYELDRIGPDHHIINDRVVGTS